MGRSPCCDKDKVKRGPWSPDEDTILKNYIQNHGTGGNWIALPHKAGLKRCGKSCRLRWLNYLRPDIKLGGFTEEEDNIISSLYVNIGSRWSVIASKLHGRTDNDVKNHWNTKLKKKLSPSHNTTTSATPTPINQIQFSSPTFLPNQELNHYKTTYEPNFDHSTSMMLDYQQTPITSESKNIVNVNRLSSQENHGLSPNAFPISNGYSSWYDINGGGVMGSAGDLLTGEFDFRQVLGEVAKFDYASSWLSKVEEEMVKLI